MTFNFLFINSFCLRSMQSSGRDHLVVLTHGIFGTSKDLSYLGSKLEQGGFVVLKSKSNEFHRSLAGVNMAARNIRKEIEDVKLAHRGLSKISFVGNSLGGIFARVLLKEIFNTEDKTCLGLIPSLFMVSVCSCVCMEYCCKIADHKFMQIVS